MHPATVLLSQLQLTNSGAAPYCGGCHDSGKGGGTGLPRPGPATLLLRARPVGRLEPGVVGADVVGKGEMSVVSGVPCPNPSRPPPTKADVGGMSVVPAVTGADVVGPGGMSVVSEVTGADVVSGKGGVSVAPL